MKDCAKIHPLLSLYAENELSATEREKVAQHLKTCADARQELKELEILSSHLGKLPEPAFPKGLHDRIMKRLGEKPALDRSLVFGNWSLAAAACLVIGFGLYEWTGPSAPKTEVVLQPSAPQAMEQARAAAAAPQKITHAPAERVLAMKAQSAPAADAKNSADVDGTFQSKSATTEAPSMVLAMAAPQAAAAPRFAEKKSVNTYNLASASVPQSLNKNLDQGQDGNVDAQSELTPYVRFEAAKLDANHYQLDWETNDATKGEILVVDANGNTLQNAAETGEYVRTHQMKMDVSTIQAEFFFKLIMNDLQGKQAITQQGPFGR